MVQAAVDSVHTALAAAAGEGLLALYRYGSAGTIHYRPQQSDINLLAIVADEVDLHRLREAFLPVWEEHAGTLRRAPLIASRAAFRRHLQLFPLFAHHLAHSGKCLTGDPLFQGGSGAPNLTERAAYLAHEALLASTALAPDALAPELAALARGRLEKLARHLNGGAVLEDSSPAELFTVVQRSLRRIFKDLPDQQPLAPLVDSPEESNLQAIYQETDHTVVLLPPLSSQLLLQIDWERLNGRLQEHHTSLRVTTAPQLRLLLQSEAPLDFVLGRYEHSWGMDPLARLQVSAWAVLRNAARLPSRLLLDDVPGRYLIAENNEAIHKVIHDYQNRLLNIRLQHELLHRLHAFEPAAPPEPLPGREEPLPVRIDGILDQLNWWATYYFRQMGNTDIGVKLSAP